MSTPLDQSIDHLARAAGLSPETEEYQSLLAEALLRDGDVDGGLCAVERALELDSPPRLFFLAAYGLGLAGRWEQAERFADQALTSSPAFARALYLRARARFETGRTDEALRDLVQVCGLDDHPEYPRAAARVALAGAPPVTDEVLGRVLALFGPASLEAPRADESGLLIGLLHLARRRPAEALDLIRRAGAPETGSWSLLRAACREASAGNSRGEARPRAAAAVATGTGTEESADAVPASRSRLGRWGIELKWPDLSDPGLELLRHGLSRVRGRFEERRKAVRDEDAWWLRWRSGEPAGRSRLMVEAGGELQSGRQHLRSGRPDLAVEPLERGWLRLESCCIDDSALVTLKQGFAESLAVARTRAGDGDASRITDDELYRAGARFGPFLETLVRRLLVREERDDLTACEVYVTAIEQDALDDRVLRRHVLRALAASLRLQLSSSRRAATPRIELLQRLHRARPGLAFPRLYLGYYHYRLREYEVAAVLWQGIRGRLAGTPRLLHLQARCAEMSGDQDLALRLYRASLAAKEAQPHAHFHLGRLLMLGPT